MTITVIEDLIDGSNISITASGATATRIFSVTTDGGETPAQILLHSGIPQYYDTHPDVDAVSPSIHAIHALDITCQPEAGQNNIFTVTVQYSRADVTQKPPSYDPADATIQVGSSVSSAKTNKDKDGNQIIVTLSGEPDQTGEVDIQVPETVLSFQRKEDTSPFLKAAANVGYVNSVALGSGVFAVGTLLCLGIEGESIDDGLAWPITYRFQYRATGWSTTVVYIDPDTDKPHKDVVIATNHGALTVNIYPTVDFTALDLPW